MRITKRKYDQLGGMRNPACWRNQSKSGRWYYYCDPEWAVSKKPSDTRSNK